MNFSDIIKQVTLNKLLIDENFENDSKLHKEKKNKLKFNEIKKNIHEKYDGKYIIQNVVIGTDIFKNITDYDYSFKPLCKNFCDDNEKIKFYKYVIIKNVEKKDGYFDRLELIIFDHYKENLIGISMISYYHPDLKYRVVGSTHTKVYDTLGESHFLWDNFFNLSSHELEHYIDYNYGEVSPNFCTSELALLEPIKLLHEGLSDIDTFTML